MECKTKRSIVAENHDKLTDKGSIIIVNKPKVNEKVSVNKIKVTVNLGKVSEKVTVNERRSQKTSYICHRKGDRRPNRKQK